MDGAALCDVVMASGLVPVETLQTVRGVAERLVAGPAAPAQVPHPGLGAQHTVRVVHRDSALYAVGAVLGDEDTGSRRGRAALLEGHVIM